MARSGGRGFRRLVCLFVFGVSISVYVFVWIEFIALSGASSFDYSRQFFFFSVCLSFLIFYP